MRSYLFVLSPSIAIYNQWKDILVEIKKNGDNVDIFLPKPRTYENMLSSLYLGLINSLFSLSSIGL